MDKSGAVEQRLDHRVARRGEALPRPLKKFVRISVRRYGADFLAIIQCQTSVLCPAQAVSLFKDCVEYRSEVAGRGIDDLQYLGGRGLLLQCLARLGQQPRV